MEATMKIIGLITLLVSVIQAAEAMPWYVKEGEMAVLKCPLHAGPATSLNWTYPTKANDLSPAGNNNMSVLTHRKYLVILNASRQGNYSCSLGNASIHSWQLTLCSEARCLKETHYPQTCYEETNCSLKCPQDLFIPQLNRSSTAWNKDGVSLQSPSNVHLIRAVTEKDRGVFTCTMSYLYHGQLYNWTHSIDVSVENSKKSEHLPGIISPQAGQVFEVDVGSVFVIDCKAFLDSEYDDVYWISRESIVSANNSLTVYYNSTRDDVSLNMTASLVFTRVSEEHLSKPYTCILDSTAVPNVSNVTVSLIRREMSEHLPGIIEPQAGQVFEVDVGSVFVIDCKAFLDSEFDNVDWISGESYVSANSSLAVYYNSTRDDVSMTASLVFTRVSEEHLSKPYTCILASTAVPKVKKVTVSLTRRARISPLVPAVILAVVVVTGVVLLTVLCVKLRTDISLFVRDTVRCYSNPSDGKVYDAYMMCYKSDTDSGLDEEDRRWLEKVLVEQFGYNLCLHGRDVLPGEAASDEALNCIEQSCCVVLIPTRHTDPGSDSDLLNTIHQALVEHQTRTVLVQTTDPLADSSLPEDLRRLGATRPAVVWRGSSSSQALSSSFWKSLRYHLPAPLGSKRGQQIPLHLFSKVPGYQAV